MEIVENKLSDTMLSNVKDIIAGAFKYKTTNSERAKYIVERLREIYDNISYNFCWIVIDRDTDLAFFSYYQYIYFKCYLEKKFIILWIGK